MKSRGSSSTSSFTASFSRASISLTFDREASFQQTCSDADELECMEILSTFCWESHRQISNNLILRYAVFYNFNFEKAKNAILKGYTYSYLYLELEAELLQFVLRSKVFFPLPGLKSRKTESEVIYFRPSRYEPSSTNNGLLLDTLCYVLNDMSRTIDQCRNGVVMIVNMSGYTMKNYNSETQMKMAKIIEGHVIPTRIVEILIVNPPKVNFLDWFSTSPRTISNQLVDTVICPLVEGCQTCLLDHIQETNPHHQERWAWQVSNGWQQKILSRWISRRPSQYNRDGCWLRRSKAVRRTTKDDVAGFWDLVMNECMSRSLHDDAMNMLFIARIRCGGCVHNLLSKCWRLLAMHCPGYSWNYHQVQPDCKAVCHIIFNAPCLIF